MRELQAEGEGLRRRLVSEAKERHALVAKQNQAQMRAAGRLALRLGVKQLHTVFRAWCVVWIGSGFGFKVRVRARVRVRVRVRVSLLTTRRTTRGRPCAAA